jgi:hypothetical protein
MERIVTRKGTLHDCGTLRVGSVHCREGRPELENLLLTRTVVSQNAAEVFDCSTSDKKVNTVIPTPSLKMPRPSVTS